MKKPKQTAKVAHKTKIKVLNISKSTAQANVLNNNEAGEKGHH